MILFHLIRQVRPRGADTLRLGRPLFEGSEGLQFLLNKCCLTFMLVHRGNSQALETEILCSLLIACIHSALQICRNVQLM